MNNFSTSFSLNCGTAHRSTLPEYHLSHPEGMAILAGLPGEQKLNELDVWRQREACGQALRHNGSAELLEQLWRLQNNDITALLIRGFPIESSLPPTPLGGQIDLNKVSQPLEVLLGIFESIGASPVGYAGENMDCFIRHVVPSENALNEVSSHGSLKPLNSHIDNPHLPIGNESCEHDCPAPNYIGWLGLRCEVNVPTSVVLLQDVLRVLPCEIVDSLRKPIFEIHRPPSFGVGAIQQRCAPLLVPDSKGILCTRHGFSKPTDAESSYALQLFTLAADDIRLANYVILPPGDILILNNQKCMHGRNIFSPRYDGTDRWLLRFYGVSDLQSRWMSKNQLPYLLNG